MSSMKASFPVKMIDRNSLLHLAASFSRCAFLDSNSSVNLPVPVTGKEFDLVVGVGVTEEIICNTNCLAELQLFIERQQKKGEWIFGYLSYDLKNEIEKLKSSGEDHIGFPVIHFFSPQHLFCFKNDTVEITSTTHQPDELLRLISEVNPVKRQQSPISIQHGISRTEYMNSISIIKRHIQRGDIYEMNFCHEMYSRPAEIDPVETWLNLTKISANPFSCFYKLDDKYLLCSSPERFLKRTGNRLISQPIKGTAARSADRLTDEQQKTKLQQSEKDRSENVMIVDLVRNDLSRIALKGSVRVDELFGVYSFPTVHHMISTISCEIPSDLSFEKIIRATFPMGSMTGAPKVRAMEIIEERESIRRGIYSGSVGYISPEGDFDFNVVIRSIAYNSSEKYVSMMAGGAITAASTAENEYDETLVKLKPQLTALGINMDSFYVNA